MANETINPPTQIPFPQEVKDNPELLRFHQAVQTFQFQIWRLVTELAKGSDAPSLGDLEQLISSINVNNLRSGINKNTLAIEKINNILILIVLNLEDLTQLIAAD